MTDDPQFNDKYIVFKREEFDQFLTAVAAFGDEHQCCDLPILPEHLKDATVIRGQDVFAGPALHTYAAMIGIVAAMNEGDVRARLTATADLFHERAIAADSLVTKKLPD